MNRIVDELASQSLDLVNRELAQTLETARGEIEDFVDGQSSSEALVRAASLLHLAAGALKIVEIHGAALLAEEMEQTCRAVHAASDQDSGRAVEALTRAMVQLPAYLDRLMSGGNDIALVLLPLLNDLRTARNQPQLSEGTMLLLNTGPFERLRQAPPPAGAEAYGRELPALAQKLRPKFQAGLLAWLRGAGDDAGLTDLIDVCDALEAKAESEPVRQLWSVTGGVLVALRNGDFEPTVSINADASLHLHRACEGEWLCVEPTSYLDPGGVGSASARLYDVRGAFGHASQSFLVWPAERRPDSWARFRRGGRG